MLAWIRDLRFAAQVLRRSPYYATVALITVSIGVGATAVVFAHANNLLFKPVPILDRDDLRAIRWAGSLPGQKGLLGSQFDLLASRRFDTVESLSAVAPLNAIVGSLVESRALSGEVVDGRYFGVLGVVPMIGRGLGSGDDIAGSEQVVVIGETLWRSMFGGTGDVLGTSVQLGGQTFQIVGVMPASFRGTIFSNFLARDFWITRWAFAGLPGVTAERRTKTDYGVIARIRGSASVRELAAEMAASSSILGSDGRLIVASVDDVFGPPAAVEVGGAVILALSGFVYFIAMANFMNLLLVRAEARTGEFAMRIAMGAGPSAVLRLLTAECVVLCTLGGALGLMIATAFLRIYGQVRWPMQYVSLRYDPSPDLAFVAYGLSLAVLGAIMVGLRTARHMSHVSPSLLITGAGFGTSTRRLSAFRVRLIIAEVGAATVVVTWSSLFLTALGRRDPGVSEETARGTVVGRLNALYFAEDEAGGRAIWRQVIQAAADTAAASSWAVASGLPTDDLGAEVTLEGERLGVAGGSPRASARLVAFAGDVFGTLGMGTVGGQPSEALRGPPWHTAVLSQTAASRLWPSEDPVGRRLRLASVGRSAPWLTVVGVVRDTAGKTASLPSRPVVYVPWELQYRPELVVLVRGAHTVQGLASSFRTALRATGAEVDVVGLGSLADEFESRTSGVRSAVNALGWIAASGIVLAIGGLHSVLAYLVRLRSREVGVMRALGATPLRIRATLSIDSIRAGLIGVGIGLTLAFLTARSILGATRLGVSPGDPRTYGDVLVGMLVILVATALLSTWSAGSGTSVDALRDR